MEKTGGKLSKGKTIKEKHQREIAGRENHRKGKSARGNQEKNMLSESIARLVQYGIKTELLPPCERTYAINLLLDLFQEDSYEEPETIPDNSDLEDILEELLEEAVARGIIEDNITERDLFDTKLMNTLVPRPAQVQQKFWSLYQESPEKATAYYYKLSQDSDYIRRYRVKKDLKWKVSSQYGDIDITINLSKPEKDPKAIAAARNVKASSYPKCLLCMENEGYAGRINHPARENHRIIPITVNDSAWGFQYSPYVYYNEHCIVFNGEHTPMKIDKSAFEKLLDFVEKFPHYFIGSNADLPIVGGSILTHEHFQGGRYEFAMAKAPVETELKFNGFDDIDAGIVKWPMSVIRLSGENKQRIVELSDKILTSWRSYTDEEQFIYSETDGEPHNTITPIARMRNGKFEMDLVLRNNITTEECPLGFYHPHPEYHHIKRENIGLIEVMGLAVLPSRLKTEMADLAKAMLSGEDIRNNEKLAPHYEWSKMIKAKYENLKRTFKVIKLGIFAKLI